MRCYLTSFNDVIWKSLHFFLLFHYSSHFFWLWRTWKQNEDNKTKTKCIKLPGFLLGFHYFFSSLKFWLTSFHGFWGKTKGRMGMLQNVVLACSCSTQRLLGWVELELFWFFNLFNWTQRADWPVTTIQVTHPVSRHSETYHLSICFQNDAVRQHFSTLNPPVYRN